jgi:hypothetical protein
VTVPDAMPAGTTSGTPQVLLAHHLKQLGTSINPVDCGAGLLSCCCGALDASAAAGLDRLSPVSSRLAADFLSFGRSYPMAARRSWKTSRSML